MLLCLVNDVLDIKQIERDIYEQKISNFKISSVLEFICAIFTPVATISKTRVDTQTVNCVAFEQLKNEKERQDWAT